MFSSTRKHSLLTKQEQGLSRRNLCTAVEIGASCRSLRVSVWKTSSVSKKEVCNDSCLDLPQTHWSGRSAELGWQEQHSLGMQHTMMEVA